MCDQGGDILQLRGRLSEAAIRFGRPVQKQEKTKDGPLLRHALCRKADPIKGLQRHYPPPGSGGQAISGQKAPGGTVYPKLPAGDEERVPVHQKR